MSLTVADFYPINKWEVEDPTSPTCKKFSAKSKIIDGCEKVFAAQPMYVVDQSTGKKYLNESKATVRFKCALLALGTPLIQSLASIAFVALRVLKLVHYTIFG